MSKDKEKKKSLIARLLSFSPAREKAKNAPREEFLDKKKISKFTMKRAMKRSIGTQLLDKIRGRDSRNILKK